MEWNKTKSKRTCDTCKKQHTMECPSSSHCYSKHDKPHWELKNGRRLAISIGHDLRTGLLNAFIVKLANKK